jgi:AraC-like DNA-binding protein
VAPPLPALRPYVREYIGWFEHMTAPLCRRETPTEEAPLIINFGEPIRLFDLGDSRRYADVGSFVTGAYDQCQLVGSAGPSGGVQVNFTLLGIRLFLARPIEDLKNRAVALDDVLGPPARRLTDELYELPTWDARFEALDRVIAARVLAPARVPAGVLCAWHRLTESRGGSTIRSIVDEVGWSQKHLIAQFRHEIGLSPKVFGRILRFGRAVRAIKSGRARPLADLALRCGYYDQSHFTRDVQQFAGVTPCELVASLLPDGGGFVGTSAAAEVVRSVR